MKKIITYNLNGIRSAIGKGWLDWIKDSNADIICIQEIKAQSDQLNLMDFNEAGYSNYWFPAKKRGYSGVAIFTKVIPNHIEYGCGFNDEEGRVLRADYGDISIISVYIPSGTMGDERQAFKMEWLNNFQSYINNLKKKRPNLIISGDYNICHKEIDIHNPVSNANSSGFLPEEREWISRFMDSGFMDSFRHFNNNPHNYTWWSFRANARARNLGWRIDYHLVSKPLEKILRNSLILPDVKHSDHCPVVLEIDI